MIQHCRYNNMINIFLCVLKVHTYKEIHDHADHIFDWVPVGMKHWDIQV